MSRFNLQSVLRADTAGGSPVMKIYEASHIALAGLFPLSLLSGDGSAVQRISDVALGVAIPVHSHMAMNSVITDYLPKGPLQSAGRWGTLAASGLAVAGLMRLNLLGPGLTPTVKELWRKPEQV